MSEKINTPTVVKRDENGLFPNITYFFTPEGSIDWRKMINPKHLVPNEQWFKNKNLPVPESIDGLTDKQLLILLGGIKELAQFRGLTSVEYTTTSPSKDYVIATCKIHFIGNYETQGVATIFSAIGDASFDNTTPIGNFYYLGPIAENRAFVRCVRSFLKISIPSQEELNSATAIEKKEDEGKEDNHLQMAMDRHGYTWETIYKSLTAEKFEGAADFKSADDVPKFKQFELIHRIEKKVKEKKAAEEVKTVQ